MFGFGKGTGQKGKNKNLDLRGFIKLPGRFGLFSHV